MTSYKFAFKIQYTVDTRYNDYKLLQPLNYNDRYDKPQIFYYSCHVILHPNIMTHNDK